MKTKNRTPANALAGRIRCAATTGNLKRVRELLAEGADPNKRSTGQPTPLIAAASAGHLAVVKQLLFAGAEVSFAHGGKRGTTALLEAIRHYHFDVACELIAAGADVHYDWSGQGQNITYEAAKRCNDLFKSADRKKRREAGSCLKVVRALLAAGGRTRPGPFRNAAAFENVGLVQLMLEFGTDINELDGGGTAFAAAVLFGQEDVAVELLRRGADPWADDAAFGPALHQAVVEGLTKVVRAAIETKADLNRRGDIVIGDLPAETLVEEKDARGNVIGREWKFDGAPKARSATALIAAVRVGRTDMVRLLVQGGADFEATDADGFTPLAWALKLGEKDIAKILRQAGAKEPVHLEGAPQYALVTAAAKGELGKVQAALSKGADVNGVYDSGRERFTALMRASEAGRLAVVDALLRGGASPDQIGIDRVFTAGITPLMLAARAGHIDVVRRLLEAGARMEVQQVNLLSFAIGPKAERGRPLDAAIHEAATAGHSEIVKLLLEAGARPKDKSGASGTVLEAAAASGNKETLKTVLGAKMKNRRKVAVSAAALIQAVESADLESVRTLVNSGADVNGSTRRGDTALAAAASNGDTAIVRLLLEAGAKLSPYGKSPLDELMLAASGGYSDIIQLLLDVGADPDERGRLGTALHCAVTAGHTAAVEMLLKAGASTSLRDEDNKTPLQLARQIIHAWSGKNKHPLVGELPNLEDYKRCVILLEQAERPKRK